jgi:hypothetical protein
MEKRCAGSGMRSISTLTLHPVTEIVELLDGITGPAAAIGEAIKRFLELSGRECDITVIASTSRDAAGPDGWPMCRNPGRPILIAHGITVVEDIVGTNEGDVNTGALFHAPLVVAGLVGHAIGIDISAVSTSQESKSTQGTLVFTSSKTAQMDVSPANGTSNQVINIFILQEM